MINNFGQGKILNLILSTLFDVSTFWQVNRDLSNGRAFFKRVIVFSKFSPIRRTCLSAFFALDFVAVDG